VLAGGHLGLAVITQPVGVEADRTSAGLLIELAGRRHGLRPWAASTELTAGSQRTGTAASVNVDQGVIADLDLLGGCGCW
jgi:hypothetical protein